MIFGHHDTSQPSAQPSAASAATPTPQSTPVANPLAVDPDTGAPLPVTEQDAPQHQLNLPEPSVLQQPSAPGFSNDPAPTSPFGDSQATSSAPAQSDDDATDTPMIHPDPAPSSSDNEPATSRSDSQPAQSFSDYAATSTPAPAATQTPPQASDDLSDIKQQALSQLSPLVAQLDQSPEEKFRTTMMLVQSTDNASLLKDAYEAAQAIPDEKVRAQALLDVVNEINYFTQQGQSKAQ